MVWAGGIAQTMPFCRSFAYQNVLAGSPEFTSAASQRMVRSKPVNACFITGLKKNLLTFLNTFRRGNALRPGAGGHPDGPWGRGKRTGPVAEERGKTRTAMHWDAFGGLGGHRADAAGSAAANSACHSDLAFRPKTERPCLFLLKVTRALL